MTPGLGGGKNRLSRFKASAIAEARRKRRGGGGQNQKARQCFDETVVLAALSLPELIVFMSLTC